MPRSFEEMQRDLSYPDAAVDWIGRSVRLRDEEKVLAYFTADTGVTIKIKHWCEKNGYRCSALREGRIWL